MSYQPKTKYKIAEISITEDGKEFWIAYTGNHADQGGFNFRWGEVGTQSIESACALLEHSLKESMDQILKVVEGRRKND